MILGRGRQEAHAERFGREDKSGTEACPTKKEMNPSVFQVIRDRHRWGEVPLVLASRSAAHASPVHAVVKFRLLPAPVLEPCLSLLKSAGSLPWGRPPCLPWLFRIRTTNSPLYPATAQMDFPVYTQAWR